MAHITRWPLVRHLRSSATMHVLHQRRGRVVHDGVGLAFWYRPLDTVLSEVPIDDRELPLLFHARTADFQDVAVQATVTYRVVNPALAVARIDFGIDPEHGGWSSTPLEQLGGLLTELAQQHALDLLAPTHLQQALVDGVPAVRDRISEGLASDPRLAETGVAAVSVRVVAIRPEPDVEKALQTPARELVQQEADRATYERRALAVERERAISENELQNKIELARREEQLIQQRSANEHRKASGIAEAERIRATGQGDRDRLLAAAAAEQERLLGEAKADAARALGLAEGAAETARLEAWRDLAPAVVYGLALRELAAKLPSIGTLNLTPDLVTQALAQLTGVNGQTSGRAARQ